MKKYWKSTLVSVMIVLGISTFYFQVTFASSDFDFKLVTVSGDDDEVKDVQLEVDYEIGEAYDYALITSDGTKRREDFSYFERLDGMAGNPEQARLVKEYRQFMRGKDVWYKSLYEDENYLGYANTTYDFRSFQADNYRLEMAVLDKTSGESNEFTYQFEDQTSIHHVNVEGVGKSEDELHVFATTFSTENDELKVYTFDLNSHDLVREERIGENEEFEETGVYFELIEPTDSLTPNDYMVARMETYSHSSGASVDDELTIYDLATQETQPLDLPDRLEEITAVNMFDGQQLYFVETEEGGMTVITYDIQEQSISNELFVDIDTEQEIAFEEEIMDYDDNIPSFSAITMKNDRLYIGIPQAGDYELLKMLVVDTTTGDVVYEGEIAPEEPDNLPKDIRMDLYDIHVN